MQPILPQSQIPSYQSYSPAPPAAHNAFPALDTFLELGEGQQPRYEYASKWAKQLRDISSQRGESPADERQHLIEWLQGAYDALSREQQNAVNTFGIAPADFKVEDLTGEQVERFCRNLDHISFAQLFFYTVDFSGTTGARMYKEITRGATGLDEQITKLKEWLRDQNNFKKLGIKDEVHIQHRRGKFSVIPADIDLLYSGVRTLNIRYSDITFIDPALGKCRDIASLGLYGNKLRYLPQGVFTQLRDNCEISIWENPVLEEIGIPLETFTETQTSAQNAKLFERFNSQRKVAAPSPEPARTIHQAATASSSEDVPATPQAPCRSLDIFLERENQARYPFASLWAQEIRTVARIRRKSVDGEMKMLTDRLKQVFKSLSNVSQNVVNTFGVSSAHLDIESLSADQIEELVRNFDRLSFLVFFRYTANREGSQSDSINLAATGKATRLEEKVQNIKTWLSTNRNKLNIRERFVIFGIEHDLPAIPSGIHLLLEGVRDLNLRYNNIAFIHPDLGRCTTLQKVAIYGNKISYLPQGVFGGLDTECEVNLYDNPLARETRSLPDLFLDTQNISWPLEDS
ncbi:MAG: hypothetical protein A3F09_02085 [Chlamydiae bacterium RIFCSPHIGHO2_12_FULL_49_11]|nr:MAG: hypothetical protein A3F09_02085 [Chlamydiae bacterium RIFCSPHIGHO2_12_FULL_49_11]